MTKEIEFRFLYPFCSPLSVKHGFVIFIKLWNTVWAKQVQGPCTTIELYWEHWFFGHTTQNLSFSPHSLTRKCHPFHWCQTISFPSTSSLNKNPKAQKAIINSSFAFSMYCKVVIHNVTRAPPPKCAFLEQCHTMMHYDIRYDHWAMSGIPSSCVVGGTSMVRPYVEEVWFDNTLVRIQSGCGKGKWGH
jgi:hypothetical protein